MTPKRVKFWNIALASGKVDFEFDRASISAVETGLWWAARKRAMDEVCRLLASSAAEIGVAAVVTFDLPETATIEDAETYIRGSREALSTTLSLSGSFCAVYAECQDSLRMLRTEAQGYSRDLCGSVREQGSTRARRLLDMLRDLKTNLDVATFHIDKLFWEDLALPHRALPPTARGLLRTVRRKLVLSLFIIRHVEFSLRLSLIGQRAA